MVSVDFAFMVLIDPIPPSNCRKPQTIEDLESKEALSFEAEDSQRHLFRVRFLKGGSRHSRVLGGVGGVVVRAARFTAPGRTNPDGQTGPPNPMVPCPFLVRPPTNDYQILPD